MNIKNYIIVLLLVASGYCYSQQLSEKIGSNPTIIDASAVVEIESTTKGFLPPRMTFSQRLAIGSPAVGLIVYCTNCGANGELQIFNGTTWTNAAGSVTALPVSKVPTNAGTTLTFLAHNLGADTSVDPLTPSWKLNGAYFQFGKKPTDTNGDGYITKLNDAANGFAAAPTGTTLALSNNGTITSYSATLQPTNAWNINEGGPVKTTNDPCPTGYRIPTKSEWSSIASNIGTNTMVNWVNVSGAVWTNIATNYSSGKIVNNSLYLPAAGYRVGDGSLGERGSGGYYWSSSPRDATYIYNLRFVDTSVDPLRWESRNIGYSVRCVKE